MIEDDVRMEFLPHLPDVADLVVGDDAQQGRHLLRILQIVAQGVLHAHQVVGTLEQAAAQHHAGHLLVPVHAVQHLFSGAPVQILVRRDHQVVLPVLDVLDDGVLVRHVGVRSRGSRLEDIYRPPGVLVLQPVLGDPEASHLGMGQQLDRFHDVPVEVRLFVVVDGHGVFAQRHHLMIPPSAGSSEKGSRSVSAYGIIRRRRESVNSLLMSGRQVFTQFL